MAVERPVYNHQTRKVRPTVLTRIKALGIGQKMQDLPEELWHKSFRYYVKHDPDRQGGPNLGLIRLDPSQPSLTVTGYIYNKFVHPYEDRFITPREAARLQGFPVEMEFKGTLTSVQRQIGDAVPVELGHALFSSLLTFAKGYWPHLQSFNAISLFSGAGGFDLAAQHAASVDAEWRTRACVEYDADRCETLRGFLDDGVHVIQQSITDLTVDELLQTIAVDKDDVHLIYGGPPCQSFSQAGKQQGTYDPRGELIFEFLRFVDGMRPPLFLLENVSNLKGIAGGQLLRDILADMDRLGYIVEYGVLNAAEYGTAQKRRRIIFIGMRADLPLQAHLPTPTHAEHQDLLGSPSFRTVGEALAGLPPAE